MKDDSFIFYFGYNFGYGLGYMKKTRIFFMNQQLIEFYTHCSQCTQSFLRKKERRTFLNPKKLLKFWVHWVQIHKIRLKSLIYIVFYVPKTVPNAVPKTLQIWVQATQPLQFSIFGTPVRKMKETIKNYNKMLKSFAMLTTSPLRRSALTPATTLETQMRIATTPALNGNTNTPANPIPSSLESDLLEVAPTSLVDPLEDDFTCDDIPETGPVFVNKGKVTVSPVPAYAIRQEVALAAIGLTSICAALAGIRFDDKTPVPAARSSGGLYHPPALTLNLQSSDRLVVTASVLEAVCGDAHALPCVSLANHFGGIPSGLLPLLGDRALVLLRDSGKGLGNQALYELQKAIKEASPETVVLMCACPSAKLLKIKKDEDDEDPVVTLGMWIRARGIGTVNSLFSSAIRKEKSPLRSAGGYDALGFRGKDCVVFSRSRDIIVSLNRMELKDENSLSMAAGVAYVKRNHTIVGEKGKESTDTRALGLEIIESCEPLGQFDGKSVFGAGVWRNAAGKLVVNTRKAFLLDGTPAKRVDGRDIYIAARDLGISPETVPATAAEAAKAFDFFNGYNFATRGGALLSFGSTMDTYLCGANDVRPIVFEYGLPGCGKSTICNFKKSLLGDACDHLVGTSEAHLRGMNQLNALGLFLDESEEDDAGESKRVFNFAHKGYSGGSEGKGSAPQ